MNRELLYVGVLHHWMNRHRYHAFDGLEALFKRAVKVTAARPEDERCPLVDTLMAHVRQHGE
jgi:hypothetical protein